MRSHPNETDFYSCNVPVSIIDQHKRTENEALCYAFASIIHWFVTPCFCFLNCLLMWNLWTVKFFVHNILLIEWFIFLEEIAWLPPSRPKIQIYPEQNWGFNESVKLVANWTIEIGMLYRNSLFENHCWRLDLRNYWRHFLTVY